MALAASGSQPRFGHKSHEERCTDAALLCGTGSDALVMPGRHECDDADRDDCEGSQPSLSRASACESLLARLGTEACDNGLAEKRGFTFTRFCFSSSVRSLSISLAFFFNAPAAVTECSCERVIRMQPSIVLTPAAQCTLFGCYAALRVVSQHGTVAD